MVFIFPNKTLSFINSISSIVTDGYKPFALGCLAALLLTYVEISKLNKNSSSLAFIEGLMQIQLFIDGLCR